MMRSWRYACGIVVNFRVVSKIQVVENVVYTVIGIKPPLSKSRCRILRNLGQVLRFGRSTWQVPQGDYQR